MDERNRPLTDEELDKILPTSGYEVSTTIMIRSSNIFALNSLLHIPLHHPSRALQLALPIHTRTDTTLMLNGWSCQFLAIHLLSSIFHQLIHFPALFLLLYSNLVASGPCAAGTR